MYLKQQVLFRGIYTIYVVGVILISLLPSSGVSVGNLDKIGHFTAYLGMAVLAFWVFKPGWHLNLALLFAVLLGAVLEWLQSFVPGRDMSLLDGIANTLGVLSGIGLFRLCGDRIRWIVDRLIKQRDTRYKKNKN